MTTTLTATGADRVVVAEDLHRSFHTAAGEVAVLRGVDLTVTAGELVTLRGRSGSGKTTLLNILGGIDRADTGVLEVCGHELMNRNDEERAVLRRSDVAYVFQSFGLLPVLSAAENVEVPLRLRGVPAVERDERTRDMLAAVGLAARARHRPGELSGGEQQRVAIARALVAQPRLLIADEPTGQLDATTGEQIIDLLTQFGANGGLAMIIATHDAAIGTRTDRVLELSGGRLSS